MSETLKAAMRKLVKTGGFDSTMDRGIVLSVDKNAVTCQVQLVSNDAVLEDVKLKAIVSEGDTTQLGIILYPAVDSFVIVGQVDDDSKDVVVLSCTVIESIALDTATALKLLITSDGKLNLNAVQMVFNDGNNGGIPLLNPLTDVILNLQKQVNALITTFNTHIHPASSGTTSPTLTQGPAVTAPLIKPTDIANQSITQ